MKTKNSRFRLIVYAELGLVSIPAALLLDRFVHLPSEFVWLFPTLGVLGLILFLSLAFRGRIENPGLSRSEAVTTPRHGNSPSGSYRPNRDRLPIDPDATWRMPVTGTTDSAKPRVPADPDATLRMTN
jgi:hypothetical protein